VALPAIAWPSIVIERASSRPVRSGMAAKVIPTRTTVAAVVAVSGVASGWVGSTVPSLWYF
jgi:hypothetical protein